MTPHEFLESLWAEKPSDLYILIWTLQNKRSQWFQNIEDAAAFVKSCQDQDVYVGVGLSPRDCGPSRRCPSEDVVCVAGLWADFDLRSPAHAQKSLPETIDEAIGLVPKEFPPTLVVATGNGAHAWWLFKEPWVFDDAGERERAARLVHCWHTEIHENAKRRGWSFDRLSDLARVLRIPGTVNRKDPANPKPVTLFSHAGRRYDPSDFSDFYKLLELYAVPDVAADVHAGRDWAERFKDKPLVIKLDARIPQEMIDRWVEADMRFRNTWFRQRHDLKDQSQSGYDMALADFGADAGLIDQQIVDLIIHHRRMHHQKVRTRADYYERTIARAQKRARECSVIDPGVQAPAPDQDAAGQTSGQAGGQPEGTDDGVKSRNREQLSRILGVRVLRIIKITGQDPSYQIRLGNGVNIECPTVEKFTSQKFIRLSIAAATNRMPPKFKPKDWDMVIDLLMSTVEDQSGGPETELAGELGVYLDRYLSETAFIDRIQEQTPSTIRRPMVMQDRVAVNAVDLQQYIAKSFGVSLGIKKTAAMLAAAGAINICVRDERGGRQGRWLLPAADFPPPIYITQQQETYETNNDSIN
jgi:hypothetical protein